MGIYVKIKNIGYLYKLNKSGLLGLFIAVIILILAVFANFIAINPMLLAARDVASSFSPPGWMRFFGIPEGDTYGLFGTDDLGRDIFGEIVYGAKVAVIVGVLSSGLAGVIGLIVGVIAGYKGGKIGNALMRIAETMLVIPVLPLMIVLAAVLGPKMENIIIMIGIIFWSRTSRVIRSQVLTLKERTFIEAAKAIGAKDYYIMIHHILPRVIPLMFAEITLLMTFAIKLEAGLSFLGLGDPNQMSWGMILRNAFLFGAVTKGAWWFIVFPGLFITLTCISFFLISQALEEILNPRLRKGR